MNNREKILSVIVGLTGVLFLGFLLYGQIAGARRGRLAEISALTDKISDAEGQQRRVRRETRRLVDFEEKAIHRDAVRGRNLYHGWLIEQLDELGITDERTVKASPAVRRRMRGGNSHFEQLTFDVNVNARIDRMTRFLDLFYAQGYLHRIESLTARPVKDSKSLVFSLKINALVLPKGADRKSLDFLPSDRVLKVSFKSVDPKKETSFAELLDIVKPFVPWSDQELLDELKTTGKLAKTHSRIRMVGEYDGKTSEWNISISPVKQVVASKEKASKEKEDAAADEVPDEETAEENAVTEEPVASEDDADTEEVVASDSDAEDEIGISMLSQRAAKTILRDLGLKLGAETKLGSDTAITASGKGIEVQVVSLPYRSAHRSVEDYVSMIGDRNFFAPPNNPPELADIGEQEAILGETLDIQPKATDADKLDTRTYRLVGIDDAGDDEKLTHDSKSDEITFDEASGKVGFKPTKLGTYFIAIEAIDDGLPKRVSDRQVVQITVVEETEPSFDGSELIKVTSITKGSNGRWQVWLLLKTNNSVEKLFEGDEFDLGGIQGVIKRVDPKQTELVAANRRLRVENGQKLSEAEVLESEKEKTASEDAVQANPKVSSKESAAIIEVGVTR